MWYSVDFAFNCCMNPQLDKPTIRPSGAGTGDVYLPAITTKTASLNSIRGALSQSCPYLYDKRRGSFSSVCSHKAKDQSKIKQVIWHLFYFEWAWVSLFSELPFYNPAAFSLFSHQSNLKALRESKRSNVNVTMTYLGQGHPRSDLRSTRDELKVLQQINGGENICVFKGLVTPGGMTWEMFGTETRKAKHAPKKRTHCERYFPNSLYLQCHYNCKKSSWKYKDRFGTIFHYTKY